MKQITALLMPLFFMSPSLTHAETGIDHLFSLNFTYSITALQNQGVGLGLNYEEKIFEFLSVKGTFGHMTFLTGIEDVYCTSVNISLFVNYYPFGNGLDKLYIGAGNGCDFMNYFGSGEVPPDAEDTLIFITPVLGWKFIAAKYFMIDVSAGYKFVVVDAYNYREIKRYTDAGPQFGLGFKIFFKKKDFVKARCPKLHRKLSGGKCGGVAGVVTPAEGIGARRARSVGGDADLRGKSALLKTHQKNNRANFTSGDRSGAVIHKV
jgi:hypothetical protein